MLLEFGACVLCSLTLHWINFWPPGQGITCSYGFCDCCPECKKERLIAVSHHYCCCFKLQFALWFGEKYEHVLLLQSPPGLSPDPDMEAHGGKGRGLRPGGLHCFGSSAT